MAVRNFRFDDGLKQFALRYDVPQSKGDLEDWTARTIIFDDEINAFTEWHQLLRDNHWWPPSSNNFCVELHVSPTEQEDEWLFRFVRIPTGSYHSTLKTT